MLKNRINDQIRISPIQLIHEGKNLGNISLDEAKKIAKEADLDLVEIVPNQRPPVCRIMDYGKFKYEQSIKDKKKQQRQSHLKEMRFSPVIGEHDIQTKKKAIEKFLAEGHQVQMAVLFKKRQFAHKDIGMSLMKRLIGELDVDVKKEPNFQGDRITCIIEKKLV